MLQFEDGRKVVSGTCEHCGTAQTSVAGLVLKAGDAHAIYFASCYHHGGHEVWIDAVFSPTWADDISDRYTFGCRVGAVQDSDEPAATMVDAAAVREASATFGRKLSRDEALAHPQRDDFWALVDFILVHDPDVSVHMGYAEPPRRGMFASILDRLQNPRLSKHGNP